MPARPARVQSTYADRGTQRGPQPLPDWVITSDQAWDTDLGVLKTGKEADVSLVEREHGGRAVVMAAKQYRDTGHRSFRNDAVYRAGRQLRDRRAQKAADQNTAKGSAVRAVDWATREFEVLSKLWSRGASVPYPVQVRGTTLMLEYLGDESAAAPRLVNADLDEALAGKLWDQVLDLLRDLAEVGVVHADLSAYNLLVWRDRVWAIDFPQAVDLFTNPSGHALLERDIANVCSFFARHGVTTDAASLFADLMRRARA